MKYKLIVLFLFFVLLALSQLFISEADVYNIDLAHKLESPSATHLFGTDDLGRDVFKRVLEGAKVTLPIALLTVICATIIGVPFGFLSGYFKGKIDRWLMGVLDIFLAIPEFILMITISSFLKPGLWTMVFAITLISWMSFARVTRTIVIASMNKGYVRMAKALNVPLFIILKRHLVQDLLPSLLVMMSVSFGKVILYISSLSFLGLGAQPPVPEWGTLLNAGRHYIDSQPMMIFGPALFITVTIVSVNALGDLLRDSLLKERD